eukprot:tig00000262_g23080.t1
MDPGTSVDLHHAPEHAAEASVTIDAGGKLMRTRLSTLAAEPQSPLYREALADAHGGAHGRPIFLDRAPERFAVLLDYLRTGLLHVPAGIPLPALLSDAEALRFDSCAAAIRAALGARAPRSDAAAAAGAPAPGPGRLAEMEAEDEIRALAGESSSAPVQPNPVDRHIIEAARAARSQSPEGRRRHPQVVVVPIRGGGDAEVTMEDADARTEVGSAGAPRGAPAASAGAGPAQAKRHPHLHVYAAACHSPLQESSPDSAGPAGPTGPAQFLMQGPGGAVGAGAGERDWPPRCYPHDIDSVANE